MNYVYTFINQLEGDNLRMYFLGSIGALHSFANDKLEDDGLQVTSLCIASDFVENNDKPVAYDYVWQKLFVVYLMETFELTVTTPRNRKSSDIPHAAGNFYRVRFSPPEEWLHHKPVTATASTLEEAVLRAYLLGLHGLVRLPLVETQHCEVVFGPPMRVLSKKESDARNSQSKEMRKYES